MMQMLGLGLRSPGGSSAKSKGEDPNPSTPVRSAMSPLPGAPRPIRLVFCDDKGKFRMDPEATLSLHRVKGPIGIVSVCGRSRQGKSFILNQLLGRTSGFEVAPTHRPCTKGLWMWSAPLKRTTIDGIEYNLLLLDSEGIDAYDQTGTYSTQIFSLAVLLSSMFIYNQMGGIDEAALDRLSLVTEMTKHIRVRASQGQTTAADIGQFSPVFVWLLRDFYLDLTEEGQKITPREYLELALMPMQGSKKDVAARNEIRNSIRALFPDRECFTLVRPVNNERDLQRLDQTCIEKLRPEFRAGLDALTKFVFERTRPKQVGSTVMTGPVLAGLTQSFLDALNAGAVPTIATSWQNVEETECRRAYDSSVDAYSRAFDKSKPPEEFFLQEAHEVALQKALAVFNSSAVGAGAARYNYEKLLQTTLKKCFEDYKRNAFMEAERKCTDAIQVMDNKLRTACGIPGTNLEEALQDFGSLLSEYDRSAFGPGKWRKLASFLCQSLEGPILDLTRRSEYKSGAENAALNLKCHSLEDKLALLGKQLEVSERNESDLRKRYEDAVSDKRNISDEYASRLASIQGKYSSLEERYGNVSQLLEAAKDESLDWKNKYNQLVSKHKIEEEKMEVEIASFKARCSSAEARLNAAHGQYSSLEERYSNVSRLLEAAKDESLEWKEKYDQLVSKHKIEEEKMEKEIASIKARCSSAEARLNAAQGKYSSLEERYGNVSQLLEAAKDESLEWKEKYDQLAFKHKVEEEKMEVEIASIKARCSSAEARLNASHEQVESTKKEVAEWRQKHDLAVKEAQTSVENITALREHAIKEAQLREDTLKAEFLATIAEKENKIKDALALLNHAEHHLHELKLQLKDQETKLGSQEADIITLQGEVKDLGEKLDVAKATSQSSDTKVQVLAHEKSHLEQMLETQLKTVEETQEKYRVAEMDAKQAAEVAEAARNEAVIAQKEKLEVQKLAMETLATIETVERHIEKLEKEKADLLQETEKIRKSEQEAVSVISSLEARLHEKVQEMEELIQSTEQQANTVQVLESLLASERTSKADADSRAEALSLQLQSTQGKLDALQQELTAVHLNETSVDNKAKSASRGKRARPEECAGVESVQDTDIEAENTKQRKRTRKRIIVSGNTPAVQIPAEVDSVAKPDDDSSDRRDAQDYLKLTVIKLKQELTKHGYGAELLQLRNPTKKDILALYEKLVLKK